jgi:hypothetical protein
MDTSDPISEDVASIKVLDGVRADASLPLQRRLRDIRAVAQQVQTQLRQYGTIGREYVKQAVAAKWPE